MGLSLPGTFYVKVTAVVIMTATLWRIHILGGKLRPAMPPPWHAYHALAESPRSMVLVALISAV